MRKSEFLCLLVCLLTIPITGAFSNDGSYTKIEGSLTGAAMPINNDAIVMVSESIEISMDRINFYSARLGYGMGTGVVVGGRVITKCSFTFKNDTGLRQKVLIGYPVTNPVQIIDEGNLRFTQRNPRKDPDIVYFETRVRGVEVSFEYGTHESNPALPAVGPYQGVYLFTVSFEKNETVVITNTIIQEFNWSHAKPAHRYILSTGATWKKPIGRTHITIKFPDVPKEALYFKSLSYEPSSMYGSSITYDFTNIRPIKDLDFEFDLEIGRIQEIGNALHRYYVQKNYNNIYRITEVLFYTPDFTLTETGLDADFLRLMYFDCGNFLHAQGLFYQAAEMFQISFYFSNPVQDWLKKKKGIAANRFREYIKKASELVNSKGVSSDPTYKPLFDGDMPAPSYYAAYNWLCAESRSSGFNLSENLELALIFGFPKKDYVWIRKDPDLELLRTLKKIEFEALLKKYEEKK